MPTLLVRGMPGSILGQCGTRDANKIVFGMHIQLFNKILVNIKGFFYFIVLVFVKYSKVRL